MREKPKLNLGLTAYDDLFKNEQELQEGKLPKIYDIPIELIDDFPDHPFKVRMDEDMDQLVESVKERGLITPITLRPKEDGRYEIVSGHRRKRACEIAGLSYVIMTSDPSYDSIRRRIIENTLVPRTPFLIEQNDSKPYFEQVKGTGLPATYRRYCIRLYSYVKRPKRRKREYIPMALREDIAKLDRYIEQMDFLYQHKIEDKESLQSKKEKLLSELKRLIVERRKLNTVKERAERHNDTAQVIQSKDEIRVISRKIHELRKQIALCDAVAISSDKVTECVDLPTQAPERNVQKPEIRPNNQRNK